jgi:hypothetical protein
VIRIRKVTVEMNGTLTALQAGGMGQGSQAKLTAILDELAAQKAKLSAALTPPTPPQSRG